MARPAAASTPLDAVFRSGEFFKILQTHPLAYETALRVLGQPKSNLLDNSLNACGALLHPSTDVRELHGRLESPELAAFTAEWASRLRATIEALQASTPRVYGRPGPDFAYFPMPLLEIQVERLSSIIEFKHPLREGLAAPSFSVWRTGSSEWQGDANGFDYSVDESPLLLLLNKHSFFKAYSARIRALPHRKVDDFTEYFRLYHDLVMTLDRRIYNESPALGAEQMRTAQFIADELSRTPCPGWEEMERSPPTDEFDAEYLTAAHRRYEAARARLTQLLHR